MNEKPALLPLEQIEERLNSKEEHIIWKAACDLSDYRFESPDTVWSFVLRYASNDLEERRFAMAFCVLKPLLGDHFDEYFPKVVERINSGDVRLREVLELCSKINQAATAENSLRWDRLLEETKI
jgi:hypothetical protein